MSNKQVLVILGSTGVGKTSLAVKLSQKIPSTLISADSRQVYKGMDVVTGKDQPEEIELKCIDLVEPNETFSVAQWLDTAKSAIKNSWKQKHLPIVVGGTGLYIQALTEGIDTLGIPPDKKLRKKLSRSSVKELQKKLQKLSPTKLASMNKSDKNNPRRLIRAIEVAKSPQKTTSSKLSADYYFLGIKPLKNHQELIQKRVKQRLKNNQAIKETKELISQYSPKLESFTSLGYEPIIAYLQNELSRREMINKWTTKEFSYAKSQLNWFKDKEGVNWVNLNEKTLPDIVKTIKNWYHEK